MAMKHAAARGEDVTSWGLAFEVLSYRRFSHPFFITTHFCLKLFLAFSLSHFFFLTNSTFIPVIRRLHLRRYFQNTVLWRHLFFVVYLQVDRIRDGVSVPEDLMIGGEPVAVTKENLHAFIHRKAHYKLNIETAEQSR